MNAANIQLRVLSAACLALTLADPLAAQSVARLKPSAVVRLTYRDTIGTKGGWVHITGLFESLTNDTMLVREKGGWTSRISRHSVSSVSVANGVVRPMVRDAVISGAVLWSLAVVIRRSAGDNKAVFILPGTGALAGAALGAGIASFGRTKWETVSLPER